MKMELIGGLALLLLTLSVRQVASLPPPTPQAESRKAPKNKESKKTADADAPAKASEKEDKLGPIGVFADIEEGWKTEKIQKILQHYGKGKVAIALGGPGPTGGEFSKNQSHYLFKDLFDYTITTKFQFVQYRHVSDGRSDVYAVAERSYKRDDDGRTFEDKIYVSLHLEKNRWVISEIKSIR